MTEPETSRSRCLGTMLESGVPARLPAPAGTPFAVDLAAFAPETILASRPTAFVLAEEFLAAGVHTVVVVDTVGDAWGFRLSPDGVSPSGLPVVVLGGAHGDAPLPPDASAAGSLLGAALVRSREQALVVLDLSGYERQADRAHFTGALLTELRVHNRAPLHVVIDRPELAPSRDLEPFVLRGQPTVMRAPAHALGCTLVTQNPAMLPKPLLLQCDLLMLGRMAGSPDGAAVLGWLEAHRSDSPGARSPGSATASRRYPPTRRGSAHPVAACSLVSRSAGAPRSTRRPPWGTAPVQGRRRSARSPTSRC